MKFNIKKVLVSGVALLMLSTAGTGVVSVNNNVSASSKTNRIAYLTKKRARDYSDIKSINSQLAKLQSKKNTRRKVAKKAHHESLATWYTHNGKRLHSRYINTSNNFRRGWNDANGSSTNGNDNTTLYYLNTDHSNNKLYRMGWIDGATYLSNKDHYGTRTNFRRILNRYKQGLIYAKNNHTNQISYNDYSSHEWTKAND